tara:strand:- start:10874 stop:11278 length:405 start_codon:yes stop_codon:yes gene_type:complete
MEITKSQFRKNVVSTCCQKEIYLETIECSGCLEQTTFIITEPTAFHKWLIQQAKGNDDPVVFLVEFIKGLIIKDQNKLVFELMDWVDIGEPTYDSKTLKRVAIMLLDTNLITSRIEAVKNIPSLKTKNQIKKKK